MELKCSKFNLGIINKNFFSEVLITNAQAIIPLIITPILISEFGNEQFGLFVLINAIGSYFALSGFGVTGYLLSKLPVFLNDISSRNKIVTAGIFFVTMLSAFVGILIVLLSHKIFSFLKLDSGFYDTAGKLLFYNLVSVFFTLLSGIYLSFYYAANKLSSINLIRIVFLVLGLLTSFIVIRSENSKIEHVVFANLVVGLLTFLVISFKVRKQFDFAFQFSHTLLLKVIKKSASFFFISIAVVIIFQSEPLIITRYIELKEVAIYYVIVKVISLGNQLIFKLSDLRIPDIVTAHDASNLMAFSNLYRSLILGSVIAYLLFGLFMSFFGLDFIGFYLGKKLDVSHVLFNCLLVHGFFTVITHVNSAFLMSIERTKYLAFFSFIEAGTYLLSVFLMIKHLGLLALPLSAVLSHIVCTFVPSFYLIKVYVRNFNN
jgi:O-antigen/teichoic acid export membrane protein